MINRCLEEKRALGVLRNRKGSEVGAAAVPCEVGTTAVIAGTARMDDGWMSIVTVDRDRFRLRVIATEQPVMVWDAEAWPLSGSSSDRARRQSGR